MVHSPTIGDWDFNGGIPRGRGLQHNRTMVLVENFEKNPKRYQDPALSLLGGKNSKTKQHLLFLFFFLLYTLKGTIHWKAPTVVLCKLNTLKRYHNGFFNLLKVQQDPVLSIWEYPPIPGGIPEIDWESDFKEGNNNNFI